LTVRPLLVFGPAFFPLAQECSLAISLKKSPISLDVWAVVLSFTLALLVRVGLIKSVGW
jgi:hypothetical protein